MVVSLRSLENQQLVRGELEPTVQSSDTDTLFWQLSIEHDTDVQNQVKV